MAGEDERGKLFGSRTGGPAGTPAQVPARHTMVLLSPADGDYVGRSEESEKLWT